MFHEAWEKLRRAMQEHGLDGMVVIAPENVTYVAGVVVPSQRIVRHRHAICVLPLQGEPAMIVVDVEESFVRSRAAITQVKTYNEFTQSPMVVLAELLKEMGLAAGKIGVEETYLNFRDYALLRDVLPRAAFVSIDSLLLDVRMIKTPGEIERLRRAARIAEEVTFQAYAQVQPGMTEADLGRIISDLYGRAGADQLTMLVVGAGERSSFANAAPTNRSLRPGDLVRTDVIGTVENYYSDIARTAKVGKVTQEEAAVWSKLVDARNMALEMIRPGASSRAIYRAYIEKMEAWGLPPINFLGHGLGLTLHEEPYLGRYSDIVLQEGMVLAVEPLVWLPNQWGMQLEEAVLVTRDGCESFTGHAYDVTRLYEIG